MSLTRMRALAKYHNSESIKAWTASERLKARGRKKASAAAAERAQFHSQAWHDLDQLANAFTTLALINVP